MSSVKTITAFVTLSALWLTTSVSEAKKPGGGGGAAEYALVVLAPPDITIAASHATDLNEFGNVVGCYTDSSNQCHGFHYNLAENTFLLFGAGVQVHGLNNLGAMVGVDKNTGQGLFWRSPADQNPVVLSPLPGHYATHGIRINDTGLMIGNSQGDGLPAVVAWTVDGEGVVSSPVELPFPNGDVRGSAVDLSEADSNGASLVAGYSGTLNVFPQTAVAWEVGIDGGPLLLSGPTDLGSLGGTPSAAFGVNFHGDFVGQSDAWPFLKPNGGPMQALPGLRKATHGDAGDINDNGAIVGYQGYLARGTPVFQAVLWPDHGTVVDLNKKVDLGNSATLESAYRINNAGAILGSGFFPSVTENGDAGFLLVPVP